nr:reverse transcriptase domain-containing protein [Tanacetum cinerariifolium]
MINVWEDLKKQTMPMKDIVEDDIVKTTRVEVPTKVEEEKKNHQAVIYDLETKLGRLSNQNATRPIGTLPSNTEPNLNKSSGLNDKSYRPPPARKEHVNVVFTRSGKTYDPPSNPNHKISVIHDDSDYDAKEKAKEDNPAPLTPKQTEPILVNAYKTRIPYPQCLKKEKMEEKYGKFINMIKEVRINVPLVDVLAVMPNYGNILKELVSNKNKLEEISATFIIKECSAIVQNKIPPKLGDPESFLIPCTLGNSITCDALADLGASINLMPYSLYAKLSGDFVILEMKEDSKVPLILERPFLHTVDAIIRIKGKELNLRVGNERITFMINRTMQHSNSNDDTCFNIDVIDEVKEEELDAFLQDYETFMSTSKKINKTDLDREFAKFMEVKFKELLENKEKVNDNFKELPLDA